MKLSIHLVLFVVAIVLFLLAAAIVDGHWNVGSAAVLTDVGLAAAVAGAAAVHEGH